MALCLSFHLNISKETVKYDDKMEELPKGNYLKFKQNQLEMIRKMYNLDNPVRIDEAIDILIDWVKKQEHFRKKDYTRDYLEILLISCKGSVERAKERVENLCTFRTIWPEYFVCTDVSCLQDHFRVFKSVMLPEITDNFTRVYILKVYGNQPLTPDHLMSYLRFTVITGEYLKRYDYLAGFEMIFDLLDCNMMDFLTILSPAQIAQMIKLHMDGYGLRVMNVHIISSSKMIDMFLSLVKPFLSAKLNERLNVHRSVHTIQQFISTKVLPADYCGEAPTLTAIFDDFLKELGSKDHVDYMKECQSASTDDSKRSREMFNNNYNNIIGASGSFRKLSVD